MGSPEANLLSLYVELQKCEASEDYDKALKISEKVLSNLSNDDKALHCKIVSLIRLSRFQDAITILNKKDLALEKLVLEKAYCYYRLNQIEKALETVLAAKEPSLPLKELEAQILYRLERYDECLELYKQVIKQTHDEYEDERAANITAVLSNTNSDQKNSPIIQERTYELLYNAACCLIANQKYSQAVKKLMEAEKLCREVMEEDGCTDEEIVEETNLIRGQKAYCLQMMGSGKEAQKIYNGILRQKPKDIGLVAIACNNSMAINEEQNVFDMKKKLRSFAADGLEYKLTSKQNTTIALNQCLFTLSTNQNALCSQLCTKLKEKFPSLEPDIALIEALVLARQKKTEEAVKLLLDSSKNSSSECNLKARLTAAQILLSQNNKKGACDVLENLDEGIHEPSVISTLVALYNDLGQREKASKFLEQAVEWYKNNKKDRKNITSLWHEIAEFHLEGGDPQIAAKSLEELLRSRPTDKKIIAKLVVAYAQFDEKKAEEYSKQLPKVRTDDVNIEAVLRSNWTTPTKLKKTLAKAETQKTSKVAATATELLVNEKKKKKRKRKSKFPKNYDPNAEPDPNRWLPKHERSSGRRKRDRRIIKDTGIGKGTQGAAGSSDQYDITKMPTQQKHAPQNVPVQEGPRLQQRNRGLQHKKKKKGR